MEMSKPYCENCGVTDDTVKPCDAHYLVGDIYLCETCRKKLKVPKGDVIDDSIQA